MARRPTLRTLKDTHLPAPLLGVDGVSPMSAMSPRACPYAYNLIPGEDGLESRPGFQEWATNLSGALNSSVRSVLPYVGSAANGSSNQLFATTDTGIWSVSTSSSAPSALVSFARAVNDAGFGSAAVVATTAGKFLLYCDEENGLYVWTESTGTWAKVSGDTTQAWAASTSYLVGDFVVNGGNVYVCDTDGVAAASGGPTGTGSNIADGTTRWDYVGAAQSSVIGPSLADQRLGYDCDPDSFAFVTVWKSRVWLVEKNTARAWYLSAGAIYGTATSFNFGSRMSGHLRGLWNWSYDGGNGLDTHLVAISSAGDVVIYTGTDPASASTFGLKGVWNVGGVPAGRRFATDSGGELLVLSALGLVPLSLLVRGTEKYDPSLSVTKNIAPLFQRLFAAYGANRGWAVHNHPTANCLLVIVPTSDSGDTQQLAYSFATKGWYVWRDLPVLSACTYDRELYFGTGDGRVCVQRGYVDDVKLDDSTDFDPVEYSGLTAFWNGGNARNKQIQLIRPVLASDVQLPVCKVTAKYDYDKTEPTQPTDTTELTLPEGHDSSEDGDANALVVYRFDSITSSGTLPGEPDGPGYGLVAQGAATIGVGQILGGLSLDGAGAYALTNTSTTITALRSFFTHSTWTAEFWLKLDSISTRQTVFDLGISGNYLYPLARFVICDAGGSVFFKMEGGGVGWTFEVPGSASIYTTPYATLTSGFVHMAIRQNSASSMDLLINGAKVADTANAITLDQALVDGFGIGACTTGPAEFVAGVIDDFMLNSDARTDAEILADYERGTPTARSGGSAFGEAVWDTAVWDGNRIHQPLKGGAGMGRAMAVAFQGNAIGKTAIVGFDVQFTEGGSL